MTLVENYDSSFKYCTYIYFIFKIPICIHHIHFFVIIVVCSRYLFIIFTLLQLQIHVSPIIFNCFYTSNFSFEF